MTNFEFNVSEFIQCNTFEEYPIVLGNKNKENLDIILKRFELKKIVFNLYQIESNKIVSLTNIEISIFEYLKLTEILHICYKETKNLKYLNTALKIIDLKLNLIESEEIKLLKESINNSLKSIDNAN